MPIRALERRLIARTERSALLAKARLALATLWNGRTLYLGLFGLGPNPELLLARIQKLVGLIEPLDDLLKQTPAEPKR